VDYCNSHNIAVEAFSSLGHGGLANVISDENVLTIAKKHEKDGGQIAKGLRLELWKSASRPTGMFSSLN
jgi:diketogulonate reductase-like aldo/keto reductase